MVLQTVGLKIVAAAAAASLIAIGVMWLAMGRAQAEAEVAIQAREQAEASLYQAFATNDELNVELLMVRADIQARDEELARNRRAHRSLTREYSNLEKELRDAFETFNDGCSVMPVPESVIRLHESRANEGADPNQGRGGLPGGEPAGTGRGADPAGQHLRGLRDLGLPTRGGVVEVPSRQGFRAGPVSEGYALRYQF